MIDAIKLLGSMVETRSTPSAVGRLQAAVQPSAGGGPLHQLLSQFGGTSPLSDRSLRKLLGEMLGQGAGPSAGPGQGGLGGMLGGIAETAKRAANSPRQEIKRNNPAAIGGMGALAGALLGGGGGAMGGGLLAVLGSLAYSALQGQEQGQAPGSGTTAPAPAASAGAGQLSSAAPSIMPGQDDPAEAQRMAMLVLRAMIQAAKADGHIDAQEMQRITGKLDEVGDGREARDFVLKEMRGPVDVNALAREVTTSLEAAEVYAASLMAIEVDTQAERDYLAHLAVALRLPQPVVTRLHAALGVPA